MSGNLFTISQSSIYILSEEYVNIVSPVILPLLTRISQGQPTVETHTNTCKISGDKIHMLEQKH